MKAVVVYESMYGNTHEVAEHIAEGLLASGLKVEVVHVSAATEEVVGSADLLVVGGPTHVHSMTRPGTRKAAVDKAEAHQLVVEPGAPGVGLREWFDTLAKGPRAAGAAFDTRQEGAKLVTGQASRGIRTRLREHGLHVVMPPESFLVDKHPRLLPGEAERAVQWGEDLARTLVVART
jgi:Flavodoxin